MQLPPPSQDHAPKTARLLELAIQRLHASGQDLWLFAYGSLIWRPEFDFKSQHLARVQGYHRALRMHSRLYRGTPEQPGLVLALLPGGSCRGMAYRIDASAAEESLRRLWEREMVSGVYQPRWLPCALADGQNQTALSFTLPRHSPSCTAPLDESALLHVLRHARGHYGSTLEYLQRTVLSLRQHGIHDRELERQYHLAQRHGLCCANAGVSPQAPATA